MGQRAQPFAPAQRLQPTALTQRPLPVASAKPVIRASVSKAPGVKVQAGSTKKSSKPRALETGSGATNKKDISTTAKHFPRWFGEHEQDKETQPEKQKKTEPKKVEDLQPAKQMKPEQKVDPKKVEELQPARQGKSKKKVAPNGGDKPDPNSEAKQLKKIEKKLREIQILEARNSESLNEPELQKIAQKSVFMAEAMRIKLAGG